MPGDLPRRVSVMNRMNRHIISSSVWVLLGVYICIKSVDLDLGQLSNPGPGFMPFLGASILMILNMVLLGKEFMKQGKKYGKWDIKWGKVGTILLGIILYALLVQRVGYMLTTFFTMILFFRVCSPPKWLMIILNSFVCTVVSYLIFDIWLNCRLPKGILGI